ncbi:hypothetical protein [Embleya scabrispora]|uniref:hypothetical protein n=1 Tax=Embleya scabrispora TaxID=159449 RepID=UPI00117D2454|nr:hypothetical protein [Embleya scabrispora]
MRTKLLAAATAVAVTIAGIITFFALRDDTGNDKPKLPEARNVSLNPVVCAAVGTDDPSGPATADAAWQALQDAATTNKVNAQRLQIPATSPTDAETYLTAFVARKCRIIIATGPQVTAAARSLAGRTTDIQWAIADSVQPAPQITVLSPDPKTTHSQVRNLIRTTVGI